MSKLSTQLVHSHLLRESEEMKAKYDTMSAPNSKTAKVDAKIDDGAPKMTKIKQVDVPAGHKGKKPAGGGAKADMGIPQSKGAHEIVDDVAVPAMSKAKNEKSPATPAVKKSKPNQTTKASEVKGAIKRTEAGKGPKADTIPAAKMAHEYTSKMPHGSKTMEVKDGKVPEVQAPTAANLGGTTSPSHSPASMKTREPGSQSVTQINHDGGKMKDPSDAPAKATWSKHIKGHNVMESVAVVINGKPKASFGVIHRDVAAKLVEQYEGFGYEVELVKTDGADWKKDKAFMAKVFEAVDAHYNNAPVSSRRARKAAMNRFFQVSAGDYNRMYESKQHFAQTLKAAFDRIMEAADLKYRQRLDVMEAIARVEADGEVMDIELITQARDSDMALRNVRNEIVEAYGFNAKIKHIFLEGDKFTTGDITEWGE